MTSEDHDSIVRTTPKRMAQGIAIIVITLAVGAAIIVPFFEDMYKVPPPVSQIPAQPVEGGEETPTPAGSTVISILAGSAVQGSPDYDPDEAEVPLGNTIVWSNVDTVPHTATSGTGPEDPESASLFDTGIINAGEKSEPIETSEMTEGQTTPYFCNVHPYMTSQLTIVAPSEGGEGGATGPALTIPAGAVNPGSPAYDPDPLTVKAGDVISISNKDAAPHTVTYGTGPEDPESASLFDTSIIDAAGSAQLDTAGIDPGDYPYYCAVHPFMKGQLKIE